MSVCALVSLYVCVCVCVCVCVNVVFLAAVCSPIYCRQARGLFIKLTNQIHSAHHQQLLEKACPKPKTFILRSESKALLIISRSAHLIGNRQQHVAQHLCGQFTLSLHPQLYHLCVHVRTIMLAMRMCTQNVTTPTTILNFHEENFRDQKSNHKIYKNNILCSRKFGAIQ